MLIDKGTMYSIKPIISFSDGIFLPTCMYRVKNIHGGVISPDVSKADTTKVTNTEVIQQKPIKELVMIEERQEKLLQQLEKLRSQMVSMKNHILSQSPQKEVIPSSSKAFKNNCELPMDVVIKVNPNCPPHYLLCLQKLLQLKISCHAHSSVVSLPPCAVDFSKRADLGNASNHQMNIVLIWKDVGSQLLPSSTTPVAICGDVNILRYLVAAIPCQLSYHGKMSSWQIDSLLDICHKIQWHKTPKERQALLQQLNSKLGKNQWLNGNSNISLADLAAWSVIKQKDYQQDLTSSLKSWIQRCENCNLFSCSMK